MLIACLLGDLFQPEEFKKPFEAFKAAGHDVTVIGVEANKQLKGEDGTTWTTERAIDDVKPDDFDALFIPGGYSPDKLRADKRVVDFTRQMVEAGKPTFAICHAPQLLITADVVKGRTMTAYQTIREDLEKVGAHVVDEQVVVDGNLVTSRNPKDIPAFIETSLGKLSHASARSA